MPAANSPTTGPITTTSSLRTPAGRLAAIGVVALLALGVAGVLGAYLLNGSGSGFGPAGSYVPADAALYVEIRVEPSAGQDASLRAMLSRFPAIDGLDTDRPLADQLTRHLDELLGASGADIMWAEDVAPWFDGTLGIAATNIAPPTAAPSGDGRGMGSASGLLLFGVTDSAMATAAAERMITASGTGGTGITESQHGGVTIREVAGKGAYAVTDDQLLVAATAEEIRSALDTRSSRSNLADASAQAGLLAGLPTEWLVRGVYNLSGVLAEGLAETRSASPETTAALEELLASQPMRGAFAISASDDRLTMDAVSSLPSGAFAVENADRGLADEVPGDALFYSEGGNLGTALAAIIRPLKAGLSASPELEEQVLMAEAGLGADLEEFVSWIGDGAMTLGWDGDQPYAGLVLVPTDAAMAQERLGQLGSLARLASVDPGSGITVTASDVGSVTVTSIEWDDPGGEGIDASSGLPAASLVVEYAVTDDRALIGLGDRFVRRALELAAADSLASQTRYANAVAELGGASNAGVVWLDLRGSLEAFEGAMEPMLGMLDATGMYASEIRPWLLPLDRLAGVSRVDGDRLVHKVALIVE